MSGESKKEEFRKYLERSGVIDALTKVLVALYEEPEKPANALDFIKQYLGAPTSGDVETMKAEKDEMLAKTKELEKALAVRPSSSHQTSERGEHTGLSITLRCTGVPRNPATCGTHQGSQPKRI
mmetsp:Transcript_25395/g.58324  ORF Transcript_25395/g.58324 Transcript_25395/m.58324 type:complete len:124 (+) Transcript_25395:131-502(+)